MTPTPLRSLRNKPKVLKTTNNALDAEPPIASILKSMLIGGGPVNAAVLPSKPETHVTSRTTRSNPKLILAVALSITLGVLMGLPLIYRKNGLGLLVVLVVSVFAVATISLVASGKDRARIVDLRQSTLRTRIKPIWSLVSCAVVGSSIAVLGGIVAHYVSPMHPLDVLPNLYALALLGSFAGFVVGTTLLFAMIFSHR